MRRIFSYITLGVDNMPNGAGASWDIPLSDFDATMGANQTIFTHRDGTETIIEDTKQLYPIKGVLILRAGYCDLQSRAIFNGSFRYLGPVLYRDYSLHYPVVIFQSSEFGNSPKCYYCKLIPTFDQILASHATLVTGDRMHLPRIDAPDYLRFDCQIIADGIYYDYDDIASSVWDDRSGGGS